MASYSERLQFVAELAERTNPVFAQYNFTVVWDEAKNDPAYTEAKRETTVRIDVMVGMHKIAIRCVRKLVYSYKSKLWDFHMYFQGALETDVHDKALAEDEIEGVIALGSELMARRLAAGVQRLFVMGGHAPPC